MQASKVLTVGGLFATAAGLGGWALTAFLGSGSAQSPAKRGPDAPSALVQTAVVDRGPVERTVRVSGQTMARNFVSITALRMRGPDSGRTLVLIYLAEGGKFVKKGEIVAQIDAQSLKDHVDDVHSQVVQAEADIIKRKAEQAIDRENLRQSLRQAKAEWDAAKLDASAAEIRTPIDRELLQLAVDEAAARYKELEQDVKTQEEAFRAEIRILELTKERHVRHRDRHAHDLERFTMRSPIDGVVVRESFWRGGMQQGQFDTGDTVTPGTTFLKIVNPGDMQVMASISQTVADEVRVGQPAVIRFDGYPDLKLPGRVRLVGQMAAGGWRQQFWTRWMSVTLDILGSDPRVIPDLSTSADIVVGRKENALRVPMAALTNEGIRTFVQVFQEGRAERRQVEVGLRGQDHAEILSGVKEGDRVLVQPAPVLLDARPAT